MAVNISPVLNEAQFRDDGALAVGYKIYTYAEGSSTPQATYTSSSGTVAQANPIVLNARGEADNQIYLTEGVAYRLVLTTAADVVVKTFDNIVGSIGASSNVVDQWVTLAVTPTYINATQFSVPGDRTADFQVNRRIKLNVSAGTRYGYVTASAFTTLTTVTVKLDIGSLDIGLNGSAIQLGLLTPLNPSYPQNLVQMGRVIDMTGYSGADIALGIGETAIYTVTASTSQALRLATADNQVYVRRAQDTGAAAGVTVNIDLQMNNTDYVGVFGHTQAYIDTATGASTGNSTSLNRFGLNIRSCGYVSPYSCEIYTSAASKRKSVTCQMGSFASASGSFNGGFSSINDNAVAWTSMGTEFYGRSYSGIVSYTRVR